MGLSHLSSVDSRGALWAGDGAYDVGRIASELTSDIIISVVWSSDDVICTDVGEEKDSGSKLQVQSAPSLRKLPAL